MENQQQPQMISLADIANRAFGEPEPQPQEAAEQQLPPTAEVVEAPQITPDAVSPVEALKQTSKYSEKIRGLIEDKFLDDVTITYNDEEVFLSEIDIEDKEAYDAILEGIKAEQEKQRSEKYISKEGLDETFLKIVETRKAGGNVNEIIQENVSAIDQLLGLKNTLESYEVEDREKEQIAINIVAQNLQQKGLSQKVIQAQIEDYIESGQLDTEATSIIDSHLSLHSQAIDQKRQAELQRQEQEKEEFKTFKKTISSKIKDFGIPESMQKVLVENATKLDALKISNTDKLYFEAQQKNPDLFAEIVFFLNNPDAYREWVGGKKATKAKQEIIKSGLVINLNKKKEISNRSGTSLEEIATR
jgi:hypothetical protein